MPSPQAVKHDSRAVPGGGPKWHPRNQDESEHDHPGDGPGQPERSPAPKLVNDHGRTVQRPPKHESPCSAVPEAAGNGRQTEVEQSPAAAGPVSAERNVDVVAKESAEGDVPAPPELLNVERAIRR